MYPEHILSRGFWIHDSSWLHNFVVKSTNQGCWSLKCKEKTYFLPAKLLKNFPFFFQKRFLSKTFQNEEKLFNLLSDLIHLFIYFAKIILDLQKRSFKKETKDSNVKKICFNCNSPPQKKKFAEKYLNSIEQKLIVGIKNRIKRFCFSLTQVSRGLFFFLLKLLMLIS